MKRIGTVFFSLIILAALCATANAQGISNHPILKAPPSSAVAASGSLMTLAASTSPVFLQQPNKGGMNTLAAPIQLDSVSYFQDTTGGNWWLWTPDQDSIGPIAINLGTSDTTAFDTIYYRVMAERFSTPTNIKTPRLDSIAISFVPFNIGPKDSLEFWVVPMEDEQFSANGVPVGSYPVPALFPSQFGLSYIAKGSIKASAMTPLALNTLTVSFVSGGLGKALGSRNQFGVIVFVDGPGIFTDTIGYQMDANIQAYQGASLVIDTDGSLASATGPDGNIPMRTYWGQLDGGNLLLGDPPQAAGPVGLLNRFFFDIQTAADPTMSFDGNLVMVAYITGTAAGVSNSELAGYKLASNFPNPVSNTTSINYSLGSSGPVSIALYNPLGQKVATVVNAIEGAGDHTASFNIGALPDGMYYYKIQSGEFSATNTMVIAR